MRTDSPDLIDLYLQYTANSEPALQFRIGAILSLMAACLRRNISLSWDRKLYPSLYVVLVGPSGSRKGTAMYPVQDISEALPIASAAQKITPASLIRDLKEAESHPVLTLNNINVAHPSAALYIISTEFVVFIGDKNVDMIDILCDLWDNPPTWRYSTKNSGKDNISHPCLNVLAGITPDHLRKYLPPTAIGGGFTSRLLAVYAAKKSRSVHFPASATTEGQRIKDILIEGLTKMCSLSGEFTVTESFLRAWPTWYENADRHIFVDNTYLAHYADRRPTHVLKLSMIISAMRSRDTGVLELTENDLISASDYLEKIEKGMPKVYAGLGRNELADVTQRIMFKISRLKVIKFGALLNHFYGDINREDLLKVLAALETMGWIHKIEAKPRMEDIEIKFKEDKTT